MQSRANLIASLGNVDGCVTMTRTLHVVGFGGEIRTPDPTPEDYVRPLINAKTNEPWADQTLEQYGGTRHRSAVRLTQLLPGAVLFVISQDGDLRVFYSDGSGAYAFTDLDAWVTVAEAT